MGYDKRRFIDDVDQFECSLCHQVLENAVQCPNKKCQSLFCKLCLNRQLASDDACPECHKPIDLDSILSESRINATINRLETRCLHHKYGCRVTKPLKYASLHEKLCDKNPNAKSVCFKCGGGDFGSNHECFHVVAEQVFDLKEQIRNINSGSVPVQASSTSIDSEELKDILNRLLACENQVATQQAALKRADSTIQKLNEALSKSDDTSTKRIADSLDGKLSNLDKKTQSALDQLRSRIDKQDEQFRSVSKDADRFGSIEQRLEQMAVAIRSSKDGGGSNDALFQLVQEEIEDVKKDFSDNLNRMKGFFAQYEVANNERKDEIGNLATKLSKQEQSFGVKISKAEGEIRKELDALKEEVGVSFEGKLEKLEKALGDVSEQTRQREETCRELQLKLTQMEETVQQLQIQMKAFKDQVKQILDTKEGGR